MKDGEGDRDHMPRQVPLRDLKAEPGSEDLLDSPEMQPYMNLMLAEMQGWDTGSAIAALTALPLEKRYVWRVASALKWAFADSETAS